MHPRVPKRLVLLHIGKNHVSHGNSQCNSDSFADGGRYNSLETALQRGREMIAEGVDIIDIGGESTRPGAQRVSDDEELARVIPVITELAKDGVVISIDTMRASTALAAVDVGAQIINDVSGGLADPTMLKVAAQLQLPYIAMHWRGASKDMNSRAVYGDVVHDVIHELEERVRAALDAGLSKDNLIIDPGIGFAKDAVEAALYRYALARGIKGYEFAGGLWRCCARCHP